MRFKISETIEIPREFLAEAREFMEADNNETLRLALIAEAMDYVMDYLITNGINATWLGATNVNGQE